MHCVYSETLKCKRRGENNNDFPMRFRVFKAIGFDIGTRPTRSYKFNVIINITFGSGVTAKPKILGYSFAERPNTFIIV